MHASPAMIAGITRPGGVTVSAEAQDLIARLRDHYRSIGKASAAHNYGRHLKAFFSWAESAGHSIKSLPADALEGFLSTLRAAGQKETTLYVMRTQMRSALKAATEVFGIDFGHLEYETGKPREVRALQKAKEKKTRTAKRLVQTAQQLQALQAAQGTIFGTSSAPVVTTYATAPAAPVIADSMPDIDTVTQYEDSTMSDTNVPHSGGGNIPAGQQPVVVLQVPPQTTRPTATIAGGNQQRQANAQPARGVVLNNHTFNGPYVRVSYVADGSSVIPAGSEVALRVYPASQLAPHGDIATFLQSYVIPEMRLPPTVAQVQFVFHELNDRKQPTGKRDEMIVSVPAALGALGVAPTPAPAPTVYGQMMPQPQNDTLATFMLQKLEREAEEAKQRAVAVQEEMKKATDAQTTFMLMQQFRREEDLRKELEERRSRELDRLRMADVPPAPPVAMTPAMPFPSILPPEPQRDNSAAEFAKALAESQKNMMELVLATLNKPQPMPPPPPPQKDVAEWLVPLMTQMNQQAMQQQQANQQLLVGVMQSMMNREDPMLKFVMTQMQEVKAAASAPKADELESFADKLQKMKAVSDMLGGGSGNASFLADLLANADVIGAGAAKVIQAAKTGGPTPTPAQLAARPTAPGAPAAPQLTAGAPGASTPVIPAPPEEALNHLKAVTAGVDSGDDQAVINGVVEIVKVFMASPEPYPSTGRKILAAFKNADDEGELYTLAKNLWTVLGLQYDRPAAKAVAKVLAKWYSIIHQQIFGEPRELMGDETASEEAEEDAEDEEDDDGESAADNEGTALVAGA